MKKLTIKELAELFSVSERTVLRQIQTLSDKLKNPYSKTFTLDESLYSVIFSDKFQTDSDNENEEDFDYIEAFTSEEYIEFQKRINEYPALKNHIESLEKQIDYFRFSYNKQLEISEKQTETIKELSQGIKQRNFIEAKEKGFDNQEIEIL